MADNILRHVQHLKSAVPGKYPTREQVHYGEITVNYAADDEFLCIKNNNDTIVSFRTWPYIEQVITDLENKVIENKEATTAALTELNTSCGFSEDGKYTPNSGNTIISGSTSVTQAIDEIASFTESQTASIENLGKNYSSLSGVVSNVEGAIGNMDSNKTSSGSVHTTVTISQENGIITSITVTDKDIASLSALTNTNAIVATLKTTVDTFFDDQAIVSGTVDTLKEIQNYITTDGAAATQITNNIATISGDVNTLQTSIATVNTTIVNNEKVTAAALTELNESCGFNENSEFEPSKDANYIASTTNVTEALNTLDDEVHKEIQSVIEANTTSIATVNTTIVNNEKVTAAALTELNESCGFNENSEFEPSKDANYIASTTNVTEALNTLDDEVHKEIQSVIEANTTSIATVNTTIVNNEKVTAAALTKLNKSCGFNENSEFEPDSTDPILSGATSIVDALNKLSLYIYNNINS